MVAVSFVLYSTFFSAASRRSFLLSPWAVEPNVGCTFFFVSEPSVCAGVGNQSWLLMDVPVSCFVSITLHFFFLSLRFLLSIHSSTVPSSLSYILLRRSPHYFISATIITVCFFFSLRLNWDIILHTPISPSRHSLSSTSVQLCSTQMSFLQYHSPWHSLFPCETPLTRFLALFSLSRLSCHFRQNKKCCLFFILFSPLNQLYLTQRILTLPFFLFLLTHWYALGFTGLLHRKTQHSFHPPLSYPISTISLHLIKQTNKQQQRQRHQQQQQQQQQQQTRLKTQILDEIKAPWPARTLNRHYYYGTYRLW